MFAKVPFKILTISINSMRAYLRKISENQLGVLTYPLNNNSFISGSAGIVPEGKGGIRYISCEGGTCHGEKRESRKGRTGRDRA